MPHARITSAVHPRSKFWRNLLASADAALAFFPTGFVSGIRLAKAENEK